METFSLAELRARVVQHPWAAVAAAMTFGAWLALEQPRLPRSRLARNALALVGAVAIRAARDAALRQLFGDGLQLRNLRRASPRIDEERGTDRSTSSSDTPRPGSEPS